MVHLDQTWQRVLQSHDYPPAISALLGQLMAATALLASTIKDETSLKVEIRGSGPLTLVAVECNSRGEMRALARWSDPLGNIASGGLQALVGNGLLVMTTEPPKGERYQGIVSLEGDTIAIVLERYFRDSEQLPTRLWLSADDQRATGLLLQQIPGEREEDSWQRLQALTDTVTHQELLDLPREQLLQRLYHQEELKMFASKGHEFRCGCSQAKVGEMLISIGRQEVEETIEQEGEVKVDCEFCNQVYLYDQQAVARLFGDQDGDVLH